MHSSYFCFIRLIWLDGPRIDSGDIKLCITIRFEQYIRYELTCVSRTVLYKKRREQLD